MLEGNAFSERTSFAWIDLAILLKKFTTLILTLWRFYETGHYQPIVRHRVHLS